MMQSKYFDCVWNLGVKQLSVRRLRGTHSTYQDAGTLLVIIDGRQMQCGASMFATLLYVDHVAILTHHTQRLHLVQLRGKVHRCLLLLVEHARVHGAVEDGAEEVVQSEGAVLILTYMDSR